MKPYPKPTKCGSMPKTKKLRKAGAPGRLYISFWNICLDNLPEGNLTHHCMTLDDAKQCIEKAQQEKKLLCLSADDLLAPYHKRELKNHDALCKVLKKHFGIVLSLRDFVSKDAAVGFYTINPLNCFQISGCDRLLVITCAYTTRKRSKKDAFNFKIAPETVQFHRIEANDKA